MKREVLTLLIMMVFVHTPWLYADVWTDHFDGKELVKEWSFRDLSGGPSTVEVKEGFLRITTPQDFGHKAAEKPMLEREVPKSAQDLIVSGLFSSEPDTPADAWMGMFIFGDDPLDFACLLFGGESNQPQKCLIGSMVQGAWQDKGHFQTGADVPLYLKLEKVENQFAGYYRKNENEDWKKVGNSWNHEIKTVKTVGLGFINNWGGQTVTLIVDFFSLEGEGVEPMTINPKARLATTWARMKSSN